VLLCHQLVWPGVHAGGLSCAESLHSSMQTVVERLPAQLFSSGVAAGWQRLELVSSSRACWCPTGPASLAGLGVLV